MNVTDSVTEHSIIPLKMANLPVKTYSNVKSVMLKAVTKTDIVKRKKEIRNWCEFCFSSSISQKQMKNHILKSLRET